MPASRSPSELSAHQMGLSLAGTTRLKEEALHSMSGTSALAFGDRELSISDRALLRKYGPSGQQQETTREPDTHHGTIPVVQRVDGHPLQGHLSLYDRMLLRKYSVSGNASVPSDCSLLSSIPPTAPPVESTKKRRRFFKKGKLSRDMKKEAGQVQEGSPCGFSSQVAEPTCSSCNNYFSFCTESCAFPLHVIVLYAGPGRSPATGLFAIIYFTGGTCTQISEQVASFSGCRLRFCCVYDSCCTSPRFCTSSFS